MFAMHPVLRARLLSIVWAAALLLTVVIAVPAAAASGPAALIADDGFHLSGVGPTRSSLLNAETSTAAPDWLGWNNDPVTTATELVPNTLPGHDGWMLHVTVVGTSVWQGSGIYRTYAAVDTGPTRVRALVWVYVLRGQVGVGAGNGGDTGIGAATSTIGRWVLLRTFNGVSPANEIIIYAIDPSTEFYVGSVTVETIG